MNLVTDIIVTQRQSDDVFMQLVLWEHVSPSSSDSGGHDLQADEVPRTPANADPLTLAEWFSVDRSATIRVYKFQPTAAIFELAQTHTVLALA